MESKPEIPVFASGDSVTVICGEKITEELILKKMINGLGNIKYLTAYRGNSYIRDEEQVYQAVEKLKEKFAETEKVAEEQAHQVVERLKEMEMETEKQKRL